MESIPASSLGNYIQNTCLTWWRYWLSQGPCLWCLQHKTEPPLLCAACRQALPQFEQAAEVANLLAYPQIANRISHKHFDSLLVFAPYQYPLSQWISALKFQGRPELGRLLGDLLGNRLVQLFAEGQPKPDALLSVPLHWRRLKTRQYNQALILANKLSSMCAIPVLDDALSRKTSSAPQVGLGGKQRRGNLRGAFTIVPNKSLPEHVAIIDDVITTGSTVNEIARVLKRQGVKTVSVYCVAISVERR